jgi:hypothetical protein
MLLIIRASATALKAYGALAVNLLVFSAWAINYGEWSDFPRG